MQKYYYTVSLAYDGTKDISIPQEDLEFALFAFITGGNTVLSCGAAIRGKDIISILPDNHKMMGYNHGYKLQGEDYGEIKQRLGDGPRNFIGERKQVVEKIIATGNRTLLGKNIPLVEIDQPKGYMLENEK